jgi:hypothetical protein
MRILRSVIILLLILPAKAGAQDTVFMLNGKTLIGKIREVNPDTMYLLLQYFHKKKSEFKNIGLEDVYALSFRDSKRVIIYETDTTRGNAYTPEQMGSYIRGLHFADTHYSSPWVAVGGAAVGFGGTYFFPVFYGMMFPTVYTVITGVTPVHYKKQAAKYPDLFKDPYFVEGYKERAKKRKVVNTIIGSLAGIAAGAITATVIFYSK